jgi:hypothetical protein
MVLNKVSMQKQNKLQHSTLSIRNLTRNQWQTKVKKEFHLVLYLRGLDMWTSGWTLGLRFELRLKHDKTLINIVNRGHI